MNHMPDVRRYALLTIDVQNDFVLPGAPATIPGTLELLPAITRVVANFRARALPVIHVVRLYLADGSNADLCRKSLATTGTGVVRPGTEGSQLVAELRPYDSFRLDADRLLHGQFQEAAAREWVMYKPRWGAFYDTGLAAMLRSLDVATVAIVGANFPNCPRTTLYEASERDFNTVLIADAVSRIYPQGIGECADIGAQIMTSTELARLGPDRDIDHQCTPKEGATT